MNPIYQHVHSLEQSQEFFVFFLIWREVFTWRCRAKGHEVCQICHFSTRLIFLFFLAFFFKTKATLGYAVDHGESRSPWQLACLSGHVEHPKNTVQYSGDSLVTTGREDWPTSSFYFLPSLLPFPASLLPFQRTKVDVSFFFFSRSNKYWIYYKLPVWCT